MSSPLTLHTDDSAAEPCVACQCVTRRRYKSVVGDFRLIVACSEQCARLEAPRPERLEKGGKR